MTPIPIIAGPTAVGKTDLSIELAELIGGEIVNADSRQVYRGMTIGTAKPSPEELKRVRHHLIDILEVTEPFSAGKFLKVAESSIADIVRRGKKPVIVGGSTLYLSALTHGLADIPDVPAHFRAELEDDAKRHGYDVLFRELEAVDPAAASTMDPSKTQRIVRALEVYRGTGSPLSSFYKTRTRLPFDFAAFVLNRNRDQLYDRINARVDSMIEHGLVDEVTVLRHDGLHDNLYPLRSPGYRETIMFLRGEIGKDEMRRLIARNTRRYAKRQLTWFRRYPEKHWIEAENVTARIVESRLVSHVIDHTPA